MWSFTAEVECYAVKSETKTMPTVPAGFAVIDTAALAACAGDRDPHSSRRNLMCGRPMARMCRCAVALCTAEFAKTSKS